MEKPVQPLEVLYAGIYAQDEWQARQPAVTAGLRLDAPFFGDTGFENTAADALTFRDEDGSAVQYSTQKLPGRTCLGRRRSASTGTSAATADAGARRHGRLHRPPAYVWISNQIGKRRAHRLRDIRGAEQH
jgi:hypothetical protein